MLEFILPYISANIINIGAANKDISYIIENGIYMALISLLMLIFGVLGANFATRGASRLAADIRLTTFKKIQKFSFSNIDDFSTGSLITRITNDVSQVQNFTQTLLRGMFRSPVMVIGAIIMSFALEPKIAWIILAIIPVLAIIIAAIMTISAPRYTKMQQQIDQLNTNVNETITNQKVIKSFVREEYQIQKFEEVNENLVIKSTAALKMMLLMQPLSALIINVATVVVVWFAGNRIIIGNMEIGTLTALITYLTQILTALNFLANIILQGTRAAASNKRIIEVLDARLDLNDEDAKFKEKAVTKGSIRFENVSFKYYKHNKENVLSNINLEIESGELVGIIGSSGSGKTTLVSLIPRLYDAEEGTIYVDNVNVKELSLFHLRESVAMVLQKNTLFSGGQRQRLCIARALLKKPRIIILDDSTSAVDTATDASIRKAFREKLSGVTKLIIAQRINSVIDADKIIVIDQGKIVGMGKHSELIESCKEYQEIYYSQKDSKEV